MTAADDAERRRLRLGGLALFLGLPALLLSLTVLNLAGAADSEARAARQEAVLEQIERRVRAGAGALTPDSSAIYLAASSESLAKAELQQLLVKLVAANAGRLIEAQGGDETGEEERRQVQVRVTLDITNDGLFDLLHGIETGVPLLSVEQVALRKLPGRSGGEDPDPVLRVSLAVAGHWKGKGE